jgi:hypothetical protein
MHVSRTTQAIILGWAVFCGWTFAGLRGYHGILATTLEHRSGYEVRRIPAHVAARVDVDVSRDEASGNEDVVLSSYLRSVDSRAVRVREMRTSRTVALWSALPDSYTGATAPRPQDPRVRLVDFPERTVAVVPLWGWIDQARLSSVESDLRSKLEADRYVPFGATQVVEYSPSWVPGFMRRSELMISIH